MKRKVFFKTCGFACLGAVLPASLLEGCGSTKMVSGTLTESNLMVPISAFILKENRYRKYIVVHHERLSYPICLFRLGEKEYSALFMRCTHQGTELQVFGDRLQCPAHGSEFSNTGLVQNGPADQNLRNFPVTIQKDQIYISLK